MTLLRTFDAFMRFWTLQSINHKKRRSTSCRLMVERLETRDLLSASTLMAVADGPFTIDKNTPIDIPVLVNDTITDPINIVIVPNPLYGNAAVNPDNTVIDTLFSNVGGTDLFQYAITDGSYTSVASVRLNIGVDPYVIYQADVSLADQLYAGAVGSAAITRQTSIEGARIAAQSSALQAYADYDIAVSQANQGYSARVSLAETNYQSAVQTATATYQSSIDQAHTTYNAAADSGYTTYDATMAVIDQTHLDALAAADAAYGGAVAPLAPYQTALDSAQANYDANPENPEAQAALAQAQANFDAAFAPASNERAGAYASAYANKQTAQAAAEVAFITADDAAMAAHLSSRGAAEAAGASAEATAWNVYFTAKTDADNAYVSAELNAWIEYVSGVTNLNTNLASTEATAQSQFDTQMTSALTAWQNREDTAWTTYMTEKAKEPNAPPFGVRIFEPVGVVIPPVFAFGGFAFQGRLPPVMLAMAQGPVSPFALGIFLANAYLATETFRTQIHIRVMAHIAETNRGADNYPETTDIAHIFSWSGQTNWMTARVKEVIAQLNARGDTVTTTEAAAIDGVTARILYVVQRYPQASRSGYVDAQITFTMTINSTTSAGVAVTSTIRSIGYTKFYDESLKTREGLVAPPR